MTSSCAELFMQPSQYSQCPSATDGDGFIVPGGKLVHKTLSCPNIQSTSGYKRVSSYEASRDYGYSYCDCMYRY